MTTDKFPKIRHPRNPHVFVERQRQAGGHYLWICHTGISKFIPDLYESQQAAIEAVDAEMKRRSK